MAIFGNGHLRSVRPSASKAFDQVSAPGEVTHFDGIYRCTGCGVETVSVEGSSLPTSATLPHPAWCTGAAWVLLVATTVPPWSTPPKTET